MSSEIFEMLGVDCASDVKLAVSGVVLGADMACSVDWATLTSVDETGVLNASVAGVDCEIVMLSPTSV